MITIKQLHSDKDWLGALHLALPTLGVIFVSSVVTLGLGGVYSSKVSNEHNSESTAFFFPANTPLPKHRLLPVILQNPLI